MSLPGIIWSVSCTSPEEFNKQFDYYKAAAEDDEVLFEDESVFKHPHEYIVTALEDANLFHGFTSRVWYTSKEAAYHEMYVRNKTRNGHIWFVTQAFLRE